MPAKAAESRTLAARLPLDVYDDLTTYAARHGISLNSALVGVVRMGLISEAEVNEQVAALMPVLGPRVAAAIRAQNAAERERRRQQRPMPATE